jgi:hypothetical protein
MNNRASIRDFVKPTIITAQQYGTKVSVELDHSDTDLDELMEAFRTLVVGLGYHESGWKQYIVDKADEYKEEEIENAVDMGIYEPNAELKRAAEEYVRLMTETQIDEALAEHNQHEDWSDELEEQYWKEQPPYTFETDEEITELEKYDDYGQMKTPKKEKKIKKKSKK